MKFRFALILLNCCSVTLLLTAGCSYSKAYPGKALPAHELSRIRFHSWYAAHIHESKVNGEKLSWFEPGLELLPGTHAISTSFTVWGAESCPFRSNYCFRKKHFGTCTLELHGEAGKEYEVQVWGVAAGEVEASATVQAAELPGKIVVARGSCKTEGYYIDSKWNEDYDEY